MKQIKSLLFLVYFSCISIVASSQETKLSLTIDSQTVLTATLVDNSSAAALIELLKDGPITIAMSDYGNMEKVGNIGATLPTNDEQITTEPGDIILYMGSALVIYYAPNSWNFTRLGKIDNITQDELKAILGDGDVNITLDLADVTTKIEHIKGDERLFQIYPNPVKNCFEVSGSFDKLVIQDINGKQILLTTENSIDMSHFPAGQYFLQIASKHNTTVIKKILKE